MLISAQFSDIEKAMLSEERSFYNRVYSKIFDNLSEEEKCEAKVREMAFVEIRFPENGGLEITKSPSLSLSTLIAVIGKNENYPQQISKA